MSDDLVVGVMGGSGLYDLAGLTNTEEVTLSTPFGAPSDAYLSGELGGVKMVFLPRHGRGHRINPSEINFRANIWGMKQLGVSRIISVSAVGSMREDIAPGDFVMVDQFFDRTRHRPDTFFSDGIVVHIMFADPVCPEMRTSMLEGARAIDVKAHDGGTYLNMEGPQFSTRAESKIYRQWGVDVIGMTNLAEAKLSREAEICYTSVSMATDYDCWHEGHDDVSVQSVLATMAQNVGNARKLLETVIPRLQAAKTCGCGKALDGSIQTSREAISPEARERLGLLLDKYLD